MELRFGQMPGQPTLVIPSIEGLSALRTPDPIDDERR
jgi:hypothetical protein